MYVIYMHETIIFLGKERIVLMMEGGKGGGNSCSYLPWDGGGPVDGGRVLERGG